MRKIVCALLVMCVVTTGYSQKFISKKGSIKFYSHTPVEDIEAVNNMAASILNVEEGSVLVSMLVRSFTFKKELMQEHFNENYMESDKFPKASFKGNITNMDQIDFSKDGTYSFNVDGNITIHGVTKPLSTSGTLEINKGIPTAKTSFKVLTEDFNIAIPDLVKENIAKEIEITVEIPFAN